MSDGDPPFGPRCLDQLAIATKSAPHAHRKRLRSARRGSLVDRASSSAAEARPLWRTASRSGRSSTSWPPSGTMICEAADDAFASPNHPARTLRRRIGAERAPCPCTLSPRAPERARCFDPSSAFQPAPPDAPGSSPPVSPASARRLARRPASSQCPWWRSSRPALMAASA